MHGTIPGSGFSWIHLRGISMNRVGTAIWHQVREALPAFVFFFGIFQRGHITRALLPEEAHVTFGTKTLWRRSAP
jgi:hypothetical protein